MLFQGKMALGLESWGKQQYGWNYGNIKWKKMHAWWNLLMEHPNRNTLLCLPMFSFIYLTLGNNSLGKKNLSNQPNQQKPCKFNQSNLLLSWGNLVFWNETCSVSSCHAFFEFKLPECVRLSSGSLRVSCWSRKKIKGVGCSPFPSVALSFSSNFWFGFFFPKG